MRISELGEFPLIDRVEQIVAVDRADVVVGIGDDVAVLADRDDELLLATVDSQVENVHFLRERITARQLGRRALAINLSDIAAMGGYAQYALVSLALPADTETAWVEDLYRGLREEADRYGVIVVGGNMARSPTGIFIDVCVLGRVRREHLLLRSGARPGDVVLVTGQLGDAAAGLQIVLRPDLSVAPDDRAFLLERHLTPTPRLPEAAVIAQSRLATAMIDISDGLSSDVGHICERSRAGVRIWADRLPISQATCHMAQVIGQSPWQLALQGGEDYELCFTAPREAAAQLASLVREETGTPVTIVGEILAADDGRWLVLEDGREVPLEAGGWEHF
ncbi:MAG TPA: thiamine-phosphate kinase [Caldilineae bacterium]|jgi:thiamine-monophosphate kinase|nr:thiamine-phosphate kinase [Caldilineae bacterium]